MARRPQARRHLRRWTGWGLLEPGAWLFVACWGASVPAAAQGPTVSSGDEHSAEPDAATTSSAAVAEPPPSAEARRPTFALIRYEEDWSAPLPAAGDGELLDPIKRIVLRNPAYRLSFGADLRLRYEYYEHPGLGLVLAEDDYLLLRALTHVELALTSAFRLFVQLGSLWMVGEATEPGPLDEDRLDLQQGFAEARFETLRGALITRLGRQEIALGSQRLVSVRKGPNLRRSFDGLRVQWSSPYVRVDVLAMTTVRARREVFDDRPSFDEYLWGVYATLQRSPALGVDGYYLGLATDRRVRVEGVGAEHRHSFGVRIFGDVRAFDYNVESVLQLGAIGEASIVAWTVATDTGVTARCEPWTLRVGARADVASGDRTPNDGRVETFDALFPKLKYFSESGLSSPANFFDVHPMLTVGVADVELSVGWDVFWRYTVADTVYGASGAPLVDASPSSGRFVGHELVTEITVALTAHTSMTGYYARFWVGPVLAAEGARSVHFLGSWLEVTI